MGNFQCNNYYCQNVSFKPEWLSESAWEITFNHNQIKPYIIDKGILKINNVNKFKLLLTKKLILYFNEVRNISIPINFKYKNSDFSIAGKDQNLGNMQINQLLGRNLEAGYATSLGVNGSAAEIIRQNMMINAANAIKIAMINCAIAPNNAFNV